jgi:hypothetical protein
MMESPTKEYRKKSFRYRVETGGYQCLAERPHIGGERFCGQAISSGEFYPGPAPADHLK